MPKRGRKSKRNTKMTVCTPTGEIINFTDQSETQNEFKEEIIELEKMIQVLTKYYGGKSLQVKLFRDLDKDIENRSNDTNFNKIPMALSDIQSKTKRPYRLFSRAGHRFVAPADIVQHVSAIETAIRRINNKTLSFPDKLFKINPNHKDAPIRRKYYLNLLTNMVWDCLVEQDLPDLLLDDERKKYLKGREQVLLNANIQNLNDSVLSKVRKLQYLFTLYIHQNQYPDTKTPYLPPDVEAQISDNFAVLNNRKTSLVRKAQDMLPRYIELLQKDNENGPDPNNSNNSNKNKNNNKNSTVLFCISAVVSNIENNGTGKEKFGATYLDFFDPTKELSPQEEAKIERNVQTALQEMGESLNNNNKKDKIPALYQSHGKQAGKGIYKINTYEESPFYNSTTSRLSFLDADYSDILSNSIQRTQKYEAEKKGKRERIGNTVWNTSDPTKDLLLLESVQTSGILIPNVTTLKAVYDTGQNNDSNEFSANLIVLIDVSGSMKGKPLRLAVESALSSCMIAKAERGTISVVAFETQAWEIIPPTKDIEIVKDRLKTLHVRGGTSISAAFHVVTEHLQEMGKANILMITDAIISDWQDKRNLDEFAMMQGHALSINVFQLISNDNQLSGDIFLDFLNNSFMDTNFFAINYRDAENFTDKVLQVINI